MNKGCEIIRDLLPLYVDKISSNESNKLIEEHLKECEYCKNYYNILQENPQPKNLDEKISFENFKKFLKQDIKFSVIITLVCTIITILFLVYIFNKEFLVMNYNKDLFSVNTQENNTLSITISKNNFNSCHAIFEENNDGTIDLYISLYQKLIDTSSINFKTFVCIPKCRDNYIDDNIDIGWGLDAPTNIYTLILKQKNEAYIKNIYYVENKNDFKLISTSNETDEESSSLKLQKIWSNS